MKKLRSKMTTEELADYLGVARQTVNRWIRTHGWKTEVCPGVKGGRARLIHIDASVREFMLNIPAVHKTSAFYQMEEPTMPYGSEKQSYAFRQIINAVENMSEEEQEKLARFCSRAGIQGLMRLIDETLTQGTS